MASMTGRQALMDILRQEGVAYVFGLPGATEVLFMEAMEGQRDIKFIHCLQEFVVVGAAEGYARTSGKPGVLNLHTGCGVAAAMGLLYNAQRSGVPLVVTAGQADSRILLRDPHLSGKLVETARPLVKWAAEVNYVEDMPVVMQRAFKMAMQPPTGPVFVSLPQDVLEQTIDYTYSPSTPVLTAMRPDLAALQQAADLLANAENPALLVEGGVTRNRALDEVVRLAETTGARVYQQWMADVNFPNRHPLNVGEIRITDAKCRQTLAQHDVLVAVGCQLFGQELYVDKPLLPPSVKVIQIDDDPWEIGKNFPVSVGVQGNIKAAVAELVTMLENKMSAAAKEAAAARIKVITAETAAARAAFDQKVEDDRRSPTMNLAHLMSAIRDNIEPGTIVVDDCWSSSGILRGVLDFSELDSYQRCRGGGSIGEGVPSAIGVKLAAPDRPVIAVCGDGSAAWSIQGLWTAAHYNLPITFVIINNAQYRTVKNFWLLLLGGQPEDRHLGMEMDAPVMDFCKMAEAMGVYGIKASRPEELGGALQAAMASGKTSLVEVIF